MISESSEVPVSTDPELLEILAVCITIIATALVIGVTAIGAIAFLKAQKGSAKTFSLLLQRASALQMLSVTLIVIAASILCALGSISGEAAVTLLSGVAGFVLGGVAKSRQGEEETTPE